MKLGEWTIPSFVPQFLGNVAATTPGTGSCNSLPESISFTSSLVQQSTRFECLNATLEVQGKIGNLLVPSSVLPNSLPVWADWDGLGCCIEGSCLLLLGDFSVYVEAPEAGASQNFMPAMTTMGLSEKISTASCEAGHVRPEVFVWLRTGGRD